ncbi:hypothetical protein F5Y18DRAFT_442847 [Xylariaceae sp. FL1019]|nr:hypothetical protein F5Y18DRAFT_442847 [Xylariaceae sp. FL1019]
MAPNKNQKDQGKKKIPQPPPEADEVDPNGVPAHEKAVGQVLLNGMFRCECGSEFKNERKNHTSHFAHVHKKDGAAKRNAEKKTHWCRACPRTFDSLNNYYRHYREVHDRKARIKQLRPHTTPNTNGAHSHHISGVNSAVAQKTSMQTGSQASASQAAVQQQHAGSPPSSNHSPDRFMEHQYEVGYDANLAKRPDVSMADRHHGDDIANPWDDPELTYEEGLDEIDRFYDALDKAEAELEVPEEDPVFNPLPTFNKKDEDEDEGGVGGRQGIVV